jgi:Cu2+-exporting ATPase
MTRALPAEEVRLASRALGDGRFRTDLSIPGMHCGGCVARIEARCRRSTGSSGAGRTCRAGASAVTWRSPSRRRSARRSMRSASRRTCRAARRRGRSGARRLLRALAVAGFAAMNIMGLSVAVWSGAAPETRDLFHWISAAIALPALAYSGRIFFASAWQALRHGGPTWTCRSRSASCSRSR